jgi:hypothetical protein
MQLLPYVMCICPNCFNRINLGECRIVSGRTQGKVLKEAATGAFARMRVEPLTGPIYTLELAHRECPMCLYLLPRNIESVPSITIVVLGDVFSGKSHYIASLLQQIRTEWVRNATGFARFICLTPEREKDYYNTYFEPLFQQRQIIKNTPQARFPVGDPLIYNLTVSPANGRAPSSTNLMIYDTSGEDYEDAARLVQFAQFVFSTSAFIFVADPLSMPFIRQRLPANIQSDLHLQIAQAARRNSVDMLTSTIAVYENFYGLPGGDRLAGVPISVMVSKSDLLQCLNLAGSVRIMRNPTTYGNGIDLADIDAVDKEVRSLLDHVQENGLLTATRRFKQVNFFATSATGGAQDIHGNFQQKIEPRRCLDPLLWILYRLGVIRANR